MYIKYIKLFAIYIKVCYNEITISQLHFNSATSVPHPTPQNIASLQKFSTETIRIWYQTCAGIHDIQNVISVQDQRFISTQLSTWYEITSRKSITQS